MSIETDVALSVQGVSKEFRLPHERHSGIKSAMVSVLGGRHRRGYERQRVLKDVSFDVQRGEFFGIVGRNGSGKSTLLKLMAGIYNPESGKVLVNGSLTPFIELGVGFNPELSGLENIYLNGALLGFSRKEMEEKLDAIIEFSELGDFMDQKLKNYSSGMQVRLAFSIAIQSDSEILILDEVLAVGDEAFQRKCNEFFDSIKRDKSKTVILVTHSMAAVRKFCSRAMMIEGGEIVAVGEPVDVAEKYSELFISKKVINSNGEIEKVIAQNDQFDVKTDIAKTDEKIRAVFSIKPLKEFDDPVVGVYFSRGNGDIIWRWSSDDETPTNDTVEVKLEKDKMSRIEIELDNILPSDTFTATLLVRKRDKSEEYAKFARILRFDNYYSSIYRKYWKIGESVKVLEND